MSNLREHGQMRRTAATRIFSRIKGFARRESPEPRAVAGLEFLSTRSLGELLAWLAVRPRVVQAELPEAPRLSGYCYVCAAPREFDVVHDGAAVNWRETLRCEGCGLINRWRSAVHFFELLCAPRREAPIYVTEAVTPLFRLLNERYPNSLGSEYDAARERGEHFAVGSQTIRMEDVTALTFGDRAFEAVLSFDVLEHVPDYRAALAEFHRVLIPGGYLLLSAPFSFSEATEVRATRHADGSIEHHLPPDYHGDPLSDAGVLCYQSFGMAFLQDLEAAGFEQAAVCCYASAPLAYLGKNILFVARRPSRIRALSREMQRILQGFRRVREPRAGV